MNEQTELPTYAQLDGMRGSYFLQWMLERRWNGHAERLESVSVAELVKEYADREEAGRRGLGLRGPGPGYSATKRRKWVILFTSINGTSNEWETAEGTLDQAIAQATCDRRHLNYGRNGFRIVPDVSPGR
jgi:hypothetical protein